MKKNDLIWVIAAIVVFGVGAGAFLYVPYQYRRAQLKEKAEDRRIEAAREIHGGKGLEQEGRAAKRMKPGKGSAGNSPIKLPTHPSQKIAILADGSFNIMPPKLLTESDLPETIGADMDWRERYAAALTSTTLTTEKFYVYPFNDETKEGVGMAMTYGAHTSVGAMLAATTNASLAHDRPPTKWGLPEPTDEHPDGILNRATYEKLALSDKAAEPAGVFILGTYTDGDTTDSVKLEAWVIRRDKPKERIALFEGMAKLPEGRIDAEGSSFHNLAAQQRECMRKVAEGIVEKGLAAKRVPSAAISDLDTELREIALMLNANDSAPVMDAIDRALALAALRPDSTTPLQAAAYGIDLLKDVTFCLVMNDMHASDYGLRGFGLAQAALAGDERPALSRLMYASTLGGISHFAEIRYAAFTPGEELPDVEPELQALAEAVTFNVGGLTNYQIAQFMPDMLVVKGEMRYRWFLGKPGQFKKYFENRLDLAGEYDFFLELFIKRYSDGRYVGEDEDYFSNQRYASNVAIQQGVATEAAWVLMAPSIRSAPQAALKKLGEVIGRDLSKLEAPIRQGSFHKIRAQLLKAMKDWGEPEDENHPGLAALGELAPFCESIRNDASNHARLSPFAGTEFTPAERVLMARRADAHGMLILDKFYGKSFGSYEDTIRVADAYFKVRPDNPTAWLQHADHIDSFSGYDDYQARLLNIIRKAHEHRVPDPMTWYRLGRVDYFSNDEEEGIRFLKQYNRADPFMSARFMDMAEFCQRYGMNSDAVKFYDGFVATHPDRYDIRNDRSFVLCQLGRWNDSGLEPMFQEAVGRLAGNGDFRRNYLSYLVYWKKDWEEARKVATSYAQVDPVDSEKWMIRIEYDSGNIEEAKRILGSLKPGGLTGLSLASFHADLAQWYIALEDFEKAEEHVRRAAAIDSWMGPVIEVMGDLKKAKGDYEEAMQEFERYIERYGPGGGFEVDIAKCLSSMGRKEEAIKILAARVLERPIHQVDAPCAYALLELHVEAGDKGRAAEVFDRILKTSVKSRATVANSCELYKKIDEKRAQETLDRINEIMAGPSVFFGSEPPNTLPPGVGPKKKKE